MMGRLDRDQEQFFYQYRLDDLVPADHLVRRLDAMVDLSWLRQELAREGTPDSPEDVFCGLPSDVEPTGGQ